MKDDFRERKSSGRSVSLVGVTSLIMTFCVLCLSVFAVLSVASAKREHNLTLMYRDRTEEYYRADKAAVEIVADIYAGNDPLGVDYIDTKDGWLARFSVPVNNDNELRVSILLNENLPGVRRSGKIQSWRMVYNGAWEPESDEFKQ